MNVLHLATDALDRDRFTILHKRASRSFNSRFTSKAIHKTLKAIREEDREKGHLTDLQRRILERYLVEYKHQGYDLPEDKLMTLTTNWLPKFLEAKAEYTFRLAVRFSCTENLRRR